MDWRLDLTAYVQLKIDKEMRIEILTIGDGYCLRFFGTLCISLHANSIEMSIKHSICPLGISFVHWTSHLSIGSSGQVKCPMDIPLSNGSIGHTNVRWAFQNVH